MMERDELRLGLISTDKTKLAQRNKEKMLVARIARLEKKIEQLSEIVDKLSSVIDHK